MTYGAQLVNSYNEITFTTSLKSYVYKGWATPLYTEFNGGFNVSGSNRGLCSVVTTLEYVLPISGDDVLVFGQELSPYSGGLNQPFLSSVVRNNTLGATRIYANASGTLSNLNFIIQRNPRWLGYPGPTQLTGFAWSIGGTPLTGFYCTGILLNVGDEVWSSANPSVTATITSITPLSTTSSTNSNQFNITFSSPLTFTATDWNAFNSNPIGDVLCARKLVNTTFIRMTTVMPQNKMAKSIYPIRVFQKITSLTTSSYGMQIYDSDGTPNFDSNQSTLTITGAIKPPAHGATSTRSTYSLDFGYIATNPIYCGVPLGYVGSGTLGSIDYPAWLPNGALAGLIYSMSGVFTQFYRLVGIKITNSTQVSEIAYGATDPQNVAYSTNFSSNGGTQYIFADGDKYPLNSYYQLSNIGTPGISSTTTDYYFSG